jgi:putative glutamine amidotransferase
VIPVIALPSRYADKADTWRVPTYATGRTYCDAIVRAGGFPVVLTPDPMAVAQLPEVLGRFDGLVITGGPDVDPARYGATERHETLYGVRDEHDELELTLVRVAIEIGMPILAICRGMQVVNVALGGTLHQHITDDETSVHHRYAMHEVELSPTCRAAQIMGTRHPVGHSVHHQAIDRVGEGLTVTALAEDGTIEAVELTDSWLVGVQWHPEDTADTDPQQQALFNALVEHARSSFVAAQPRKSTEKRA